MRITAIRVLLGVWVLFPAVIGLALNTLQTRARRLVALYSVALGVLQILSYGWALAGWTNMWISQLLSPLSGAVLVMAFAAWHRPGRIRTLLNGLAVVVVGGPLILAFALESINSLSSYVSTFYGLTVLVAGVVSTTALALKEEGRPWESDWFWVGAGAMLFMGSYVAYAPVQKYMAASRRDLFVSVEDVFNTVVAASILAIAWGLRCPLAEEPRQEVRPQPS